jgi:rhodanese-related sulfurtransferase
VAVGDRERSVGIIASRFRLAALTVVVGPIWAAPAFAGDALSYPVGITYDLPYVDLPGLRGGRPVRLQRNQDPESMLDWDWALISRKCPPFCIQPMQLSPGVETIGELEMIGYLKRISEGDTSVLVVDCRTRNWIEKGMIPGAISIPWPKLDYRHANREDLVEILEFSFGVMQEDHLLNFENARTLVLYCNGNWCGQSPTSIRSLLMLGYPAHKLKWYRGGMQAWKMLGLTTVPPPVDGEAGP